MKKLIRIIRVNPYHYNLQVKLWNLFWIPMSFFGAPSEFISSKEAEDWIKNATNKKPSKVVKVFWI